MKRTVTDTIRGLLAFRGRTGSDMARELDLIRSTWAAKIKRNNWTAEDLIRIADALDAEVCFKMDDELYPMGLDTKKKKH